MNLFAELQVKEISKRFHPATKPSLHFIKLLEDLQQDISLFEDSLFENVSLNDVHNYLKASHDFYLTNWLPKINDTVSKLAKDNSCIVHVRKLLVAFLEKYRIELVQHIALEEKILIQFVSEMLVGKYRSDDKDFVINHFLFTHNDNVIVHLDELKNDLMMLDDKLKTNLVFQVLFNQLEIFQHDLMLHGLIEDLVYIPKMLDYISTHFEELPRI